MSETAIVRAIRAAVNRDGRCRVVRNNTGVDVAKGVRYGLGSGGADLVGMVVGSGRVFCLEVKTARGRTTAEQDRWLESVRRLGGCAWVVRSVADAMRAVEMAVRA